MKWRSTWDLTSIPEAEFNSEKARRNSLRRTTFGGGRPVILKPCPYCRKKMATRELALHKGKCPSNPRNLP
jgi:hypothetical protein